MSESNKVVVPSNKENQPASSKAPKQASTGAIAAPPTNPAGEVSAEKQQAITITVRKEAAPAPAPATTGPPKSKSNIRLNFLQYN